MIAHVAEAGEDRGRVVVRLGETATSSPAALAAAIHVARAFRSEIEAIFAESPDIAAATAHDRARFVATNGGSRAFPQATLTAGLTHFASASVRQFAAEARACGVSFKAKVVHDEPIPALSAACAERGPWNIVAFAEPITSRARAAVLNDALARVWGTTAFIAAGPMARWRPGPILAVVEDIERLTGLVRTAERLAALTGETVLVLPAAEDAIAQDWLEGEVALTLAPAAGTKVLSRPPFYGPAAILSEIERHRPRLVLARHGGQVIPPEGTECALAALSAPAFILH